MKRIRKPTRNVSWHVYNSPVPSARLVPRSRRGLFVIDDKGILRQITINDLPVGRSVDETLRLVQAFQHTDKHGEGESNLPLPDHAVSPPAPPPHPPP